MAFRDAPTRPDCQRNPARAFGCAPALPPCDRAYGLNVCVWRICVADRALGFAPSLRMHPKFMSQQGEAGPHGCFFALVEEAGGEDEQCRAVQAPSGFVAFGLITGLALVEKAESRLPA